MIAWSSTRSRNSSTIGAPCVDGLGGHLHPSDRLEWTHHPGAFTLGDLVRHLATTERYLARKCLTPVGTPLTKWKWLRAMCEHEAHHRGQIYLMLGMLDVATPPLYGSTSEEVLARSVRAS